VSDRHLGILGEALDAIDENKPKSASGHHGQVRSFCTGAHLRAATTRSRAEQPAGAETAIPPFLRGCAPALPRSLPGQRTVRPGRDEFA